MPAHCPAEPVYSTPSLLLYGSALLQWHSCSSCAALQIYLCI